MSGKRGNALAWGGVSLALVAVLALVQACSSNVHTFRYRLNFAVDIDGETKSASSIIQAWYERFGSQNAAGATGTAWYRGVAPIIDLGKHGYLIAALSASCIYPYKQAVEKGLYPFNRSEEYGKVCKRAVEATELPKAFGLGYGSELERLREGKRDLADDNYPAFIWIAKGASWRQTKRICPEEFASVIGTDVKLRSISIEAAPKAPLVNKLELNAPWLDEMRLDSAQGRRFSFIADYCKPGSGFLQW